MNHTAPARILVIDDNTAIHDDFRKVLTPERGASMSFDEAAATLFRRPAPKKPQAAMRVDFAPQGQDGLACVQAALQAGEPFTMAFIDMRMPPGWDGLETIVQIWKVQPELLVVICTAFSDYSWEQMNRRLGQSDRFLILKKPFDNVEVRQFAHSLTARSSVERTLTTTQQQLVVASRQAGMAEVATGVLHNVGNVLNSVTVSAGIMTEKLRCSKAPKLAKAAALLQEKKETLPHFLTEDPVGKKLPGYLARLGEHLIEENSALVGEMDRLGHNIEHIKEVVAMQQTHAKGGGMTEALPLDQLVEDAILMHERASGGGIVVERRFSPAPRARVDRHKVLQILINLLRNAKHALDDVEGPDKRITISIEPAGERVRVSIADNGIGIPAENLDRIFGHGFTTKKSGHGFGLHSGALAAKEMGGALSVHSDGPGHGATFTLELPIASHL